MFIQHAASRKRLLLRTAYGKYILLTSLIMLFILTSIVKCGKKQCEENAGKIAEEQKGKETKTLSV